MPIRFSASFPISRNPVDPSPTSSVSTTISRLRLAKAGRSDYPKPVCARWSDHQPGSADSAIPGTTGFYLQPPRQAKSRICSCWRTQVCRRHYVRRYGRMARNAAVQRRGLRIEHQGENREINLEVIPISSTSARDRYYLVVFQRTSPRPAIADAMRPPWHRNPNKPG